MKKVLIGCGILVLLIVLAGAGAVVWFKSNEEELRARGEAAAAEGLAFAANTDQDGCVEEALRRTDEEGGFLSAVAHGIFLEACLEAADPGSSPLCDGVPPMTAIGDSVSWRLAFCEDRGRAGDSSCNTLSSTVQEFCNESGGG